MVNTIYLNAVSNTKAKKGERLSADASYMEKAFITIYHIIFLMLIESAKLNKNNREEYLQDIFLVLFSFLQQGKYEICEPSYALLARKEGVTSDIKLMSQVNRWICIIALRGLSEIEEEIESFDVSALNKSFQLAKDVLLERYDSTSRLLETMLNTKEFDATAVEEWPLFIWYRQSEEYTKLRERLPELFKIEKAEVEQENCEQSSENEPELNKREQPVCV